MTSTASFAAPLMGTGVIQIICGIVVILIDLIALAAYGFSAPGTFLGIILGIFFIITGALTIATSSAFRKGSDNGHCLAVSALVLSILSILISFSIIIWTGVSVAGVKLLTADDCLLIPDYPYICLNKIIYGLLGADVAFLVIMLISSIVACVYSSKGLSSNCTSTTYVTRVA